tara:strand:- start:819 stop:1454 length:636 start_codon:yes stop_codon:yes gene_type:complete
MSWRFPKHKLSAGQTVTPENLNEGLRPTAEELSGQLNEHNWKEATIPSFTNCQSDCAFVWHSTGVYSDADPGNYGVNFLEFPATATWQQLEDTKVTKSTPACILWIHASFQVMPIVFTSSGLPTLGAAIMVDGQVIQETIVGSGDLSNESSLGSQATGIQMLGVPFATSVALPVASGEHTVSIVVRANPTATNDKGIVVQSRELIVLQMRR